jgi:hypothetical protein
VGFIVADPSQLETLYINTLPEVTCSVTNTKVLADDDTFTGIPLEFFAPEGIYCFNRYIPWAKLRFEDNVLGVTGDDPEVAILFTEEEAPLVSEK